jgi:hypothetical protein
MLEVLKCCAALYTAQVASKQHDMSLGGLKYVIHNFISMTRTLCCRYYVLQNSFSAAGRSLLLARSLRVRLWDDSNAAVRQLPSVGKLLAARLAAAGLGR